jgi:RsiW-degrading membrane proteinase PrsW (M82 family)
VIQLGFATQVLVIGAALPVLLILLWTRYRDRLPEPPKVVFITFLLGALATIPILIVNVLLVAVFGFPESVTTIRDALVMSFISAALVEELFKFAVLRGYAARHDAFDEPYDGIVYGVAASLGFAFVENLLYVFMTSTSFDERLVVAVMRAILSVPLHANCGAIMGFAIGVARFSQGPARIAWTLFGLGAAIVLHGVYNTFVFSAETTTVVNAGLEWACFLAAVVTAAVGAAAASLLAARLRRDQHRRHARALTLAHVGCDEVSLQHATRSSSAFAANEESLPPRPPTPPFPTTLQHPPPWPPTTQQTPVLPIAALVVSAVAGVVFVLSILLAALTDLEGAPDDSPVLITIGLGILASLLGTLIAGVLALVALALRKPWPTASIIALVVSVIEAACAGAIVLIGIAAEST